MISHFHGVHTPVIDTKAKLAKVIDEFEGVGMDYSVPRRMAELREVYRALAEN